MIKIFTDTGADYPYDVEEIQKLPLHYYFEDDKNVEYGSEINISMKEFYDEMRKERIPKTSSVNVEMTRLAFEKELIDGNDIICIGLTSGISSCYANEFMAASMLRDKYKDRKIVVIDSLIGSLPQAMLAIKANMMVKEGASFEDIVKYVEDNNLFYNYEIFLEDLIYPVRGGRVNAVVGTVSQRLNIKPLIRVDANGKTVIGTTSRGSKKLADKLINRMLVDGADNVTELGIVHGDNLEEALNLKDKLLKLGITDDVSIAEVGQVIGSYAGPGAIGLVSKKKVRRK